MRSHQSYQTFCVEQCDYYEITTIPLISLLSLDQAKILPEFLEPCSNTTQSFRAKTVSAFVSIDRILPYLSPILSNKEMAYLHGSVIINNSLNLKVYWSLLTYKLIYSDSN